VVRIRIIQKPPVAGIDGIRLDCFQAGREYEVGNSVGALLLAEGWAEPVPLDAPRPYLPFSENDPFDSRVLYRDQPPNLTKEKKGPYLERDAAADSPWRRRTRRR
jgi:hypothetical protein